MNLILGIVASAATALAFVVDYFTRADNANDLGSVSGQKWKIWRGAWAIVSNKASSSSSGSTNALATLKFTSTDVTVSISGADPGMGASFWVTDADNWYASVYTQTEVCQTCSNCNSFSGGNCNAFNPETCSWLQPGNCGASGTFCCSSPTPGNCNSFNASNCNAFGPGNCNVFNSANTGNMAPPYGFCYGPSRNPPICNGTYNTSTCNSFNPPVCNAGLCCNGSFNTWSPYCLQYAPGNCNSFNPVVCNAFFTFSCNCVVEHRISLIKSLTNSVSTLSSSLFSAAIQSFKIILSGDQATIEAFSNSSYSSQIGNSVIQSISSPQKTKDHGIIKSTSSYQQGSSIEEFGVSQ